MPTAPSSRLRTVSTLILKCIIGFAVMAAIAIVSIVIVISVSPTNDVQVFSVPIQIGARTPDFSLSGHGQLINYGAADDIRAINVIGPVRPVIETHATAKEIVGSDKIQGAQDKAGRIITGAFEQWAIERSIAVALVGSVLFALVWRLFPHAWRGRITSSLHRPLLIFLGCGAVLSLLWFGSLYTAYAGSQGLKHIHSVSDLFNYDEFRTAPAPVGPKVTGYQIAVIGDSRASLWGGQAVPSPTGYDLTCNRSRDSLAAQLEQLNTGQGWHALNLACPSATIAQGLLGPQHLHGRDIPPQVGLLKQLTDLKQVVVMIGPNDVHWSLLLGACFFTTCDVTPVDNSISSQLADFQTQTSDLLAELGNLPTHPEVVVVGSYSPYTPTADCADTQMSAGQVITTPEIMLMNDSANQLNAILRDAAASKKFTYITPQLRALCEPDTTGLGPEIEGVKSKYLMHPTALGELMIATQVNRVMNPPGQSETADKTSSTVGGPAPAAAAPLNPGKSPG